MFLKILNLTKQLIKFKTVEKNYNDLNKIIFFLKDFLKSNNVKIFERKRTLSLLAFNSKSIPKKFKIILNAHLDVIPNDKRQQYIPRVKGGKIYGGGVFDMKAAAAVEILLFKELAKKVSYPLALQLVTDEEVGGFNGTKYQIEKGVRGNFVIVGEPTNFNIENTSKGIIWLEISCKGISSHSAYPWKGLNAVWKMIYFLNKLKEVFPEYKKEVWKSTLNLARIETTNTAFNKIPDNCKVYLDLRYIPEDKNLIINKVRNLVPKDFKIKIILNEPGQYTPKNNPYLKKLKKIAEKELNKKILVKSGFGSSDIRHYNQVGIPGVEFGPVGGGMGENNEWVDIKSLEKYYQILKNFLQLI